MVFDRIDLGLSRYEDAYRLQVELVDEIIRGNRGPTLIFTEHEPVVTLGAGYHPDNLLLTPDQFATRGISLAVSDRGGDVTLHLPGQLVAYPLLDLTTVGRDLHLWLRALEQAVIDTLPAWGVVGGRNPINTGVWVGADKICAIGIKVRKWVSMHGLALNVDPDLALFETIVPCGIRGAYGVTSLACAGSRSVPMAEVKDKLAESLDQIVREPPSSSP